MAHPVETAFGLEAGKNRWTPPSPYNPGPLKNTLIGAAGSTLAKGPSMFGKAPLPPAKW
jgi:hypothetical protein